MDNQHRKISGYRELSQAEIDLMNEIKAEGARLQVLVAKVRAHVTEQWDAGFGLNETESDATELDRLDGAEPESWVRLAEVDLQVGIMKLVRSVAQPTTF